MNLNEIEAVWRSSHNQPDPRQTERERSEFVATLRKRDRGFFVGMILIFTWLVVLTGRLLWVLVSPDPVRDRIDFTREWAVILFLLLPWIAAIVFVRQHRERQSRYQEYTGSIAESLRALVDQSRGAEARMRSMLLLHLVGVPLLALSIAQILAVGKARPQEVSSMIVVFALCIAVSTACLTWALFRNRRETRRLQALLAAYR